MMEQGNYKWMVCVRCFTYNQSKFIVDAMNGFALQQTNYPYVCCIIDDASTDGEQDVIKKYLLDNFDIDNKAAICNQDKDDYILSFAQHNTNKNCYFAVLFLKTNHYSIKRPKMQYLEDWINKSKYCALCEGDDYWIDAHKLQRQVDLLESDNDCSLCYHACKNVYDDNFKEKQSNICESVPEHLTYKDFLPGYPFQTASVLYRASLHNSQLYKMVYSTGGMSSAIFFITIGQFGYFRGFNEQMSVYRRNAGGISVATKNETLKLYISTQVKICGLFASRAKYYMIFNSIGPILFSLFLNSRKDFYPIASSAIKTHPSILISLCIHSAKICLNKLLCRIMPSK